MTTKLMIAALAALFGGLAPGRASAEALCGGPEPLSGLFRRMIITLERDTRRRMIEELFDKTECLARENALKRSGLKGRFAIALDVIASLSGEPLTAAPADEEIDDKVRYWRLREETRRAGD